MLLNPLFMVFTLGAQNERRVVMKRNTASRKAGFTLVEIMIVVAIIGMLAAIAIPNFVKARKASQASSCVNNMRQIQGAKATWALENKKLGTDTPATTDLYGADKYIKAEPKCPSKETVLYITGTVDATVTCGNVGTETNHVLSASY